jgi:hypothetical protein
MEKPSDLDRSRERARLLAEGMSILADREDLLARMLEASANQDAAALAAALGELPGDPIGPDQCFHYMLVSLPVDLPIFERICRWSCGIHAGEVVARDGSVELASGRPTKLSQEVLGLLEDLGVISCGLEGHIDRQFIDVWQQVCRPDFLGG